MYYDQHGNMKAAGAEADGAAVLAQAEDEGWIKTELYVAAIIDMIGILNIYLQVQVTSPAQVNDSQNERHAPFAASPRKDSRRRLRRLSLLPVPLHALVCRRHARQRSFVVAGGRTRHPICALAS